MNYLHAYHAGHATDVFKHFVLFELLHALLEKDKPLSYLETHAGFAYYDLHAKSSQTTKAHQTGISLLWKTQAQGRLELFLSLIKKLNSNFHTNTLRYYPGSAWIASQLLGKNPLYLCDKNEMAIKHLKAYLPGTCHLYPNDGYTSLTSLLPPKTKRGLLFIDPPYETPDEWDAVLQACHTVYQRWRYGTVALWYPIKNDPCLKKFYRALQQLPFEKKENIEFFLLSKDVSQRLNGAGMFLINPPWQFKKNISPSLTANFVHLKAGLGACAACRSST